MNTGPVIVERIFNAPILRVWEAITDKDKMKQWYFDLAEFKLEVGFEFSFTAGDGTRQFLHLCKVTEVIPGRKLAHTWRYEGYTGDSLVTWELLDEEGKTRVKLTHDKIYTFPADAPELDRKNFAQGWVSIINTALKDYLERKKA